MSVSSFLGPDFWDANREDLNVYLVGDGRICFFCCCPDFEFLSSCITSPIAFWAVLNFQRISSSCLLITNLQYMILLLYWVGQYDGPRCAAALALLHFLMVWKNTYKLTMGICKALPYYL
jgi:hypothetical protein